MNRIRGCRGSVGFAAGCAALSIALATGACSAPEMPSAAGPKPVSSPAPQRAVPTSVDPVALAGVRERAFEILESAATGRDPLLRANALEGLEQVPPRAESMVRRGLQDPNVGVRTVAALIAGRAGLERLEPELRTRERDPSTFVRLAVLYALAHNDFRADLSPLGTTLFESDDPRLRAHAAFILGELGDPSALPMLRQAANEPVPRGNASAVSVMRQQIGEAIVKLGDPGPLQGLRAALYPSRPEDLELTALAVQIIGTVGDEASIGQLIYLSATKDGERFLPPEIRLSVAQALGRMGRTEGVFLADEYRAHEDAMIREQAAHVYGWTLEPGQAEALVPMLEDRAPRVRVAAAAAVLRVSGRAMAGSGG
ncbi:MAG: HEAT repeat domain-containing protein [Planctomycetota bacterium]